MCSPSPYRSYELGAEVPGFPTFEFSVTEFEFEPGQEAAFVSLHSLSVVSHFGLLQRLEALPNPSKP